MCFCCRCVGVSGVYECVCVVCVCGVCVSVFYVSFLCVCVCVCEFVRGLIIQPTMRMHHTVNCGLSLSKIPGC